MATQPAPQPNPSFEPSPEAIKQAERIAERMISQLFSGSQKFVELDSENVYTEDVRTNIQLLHDQINLIRNLYPGIKHPTMNIFGLDIPIDFLQNVEGFEDDARPSYFDIINSSELADRVHTELLSYQDDQKDGFSAVESERLKENVKFFLRVFLAFRAGFKPNMFSGKLKNGPPLTASNGSHTHFLTVKLKTINRGLLVKYSPAYFVSWKYFGHPSTPVTGSLTPGTYIFGGSSAVQPFVYDGSTLINIPPDLNISLNAF